MSAKEQWKDCYIWVKERLPKNYETIDRLNLIEEYYKINTKIYYDKEKTEQEV